MVFAGCFFLTINIGEIYTYTAKNITFPVTKQDSAGQCQTANSVNWKHTNG